MKKLFKILASAVVSAAIMASSVVCAFADEKLSDVNLDTKDAVAISNWGQSFKAEYQNFDASRMTESSQIKVEYTCENVDENSGTAYPAELIFQSWESPDTPMADAQGGVWAKVAPVEYSETSAVYNYKDIVESYGTDDFSQVSCILVGATDKATITVTKVTVTNCKAEGTRVYEDPEDESGSNLWLIIVGCIAAVAIIVIIIIVVVMNKKSSEAFDVSTGQFVDKKELSDKDK
jgi:hypothetical protein